MYLTEIIKHKIIEVAERKNNVPLEVLKAKSYSLPLRRGFKEAISTQGNINLIAEVKKASPSAGVIREDFDPVAIAMEYEQAGAKAISVLTDEKFFQGSMDILKTVREHVHIPVLCKDFIINEYQIYEASIAGADAILLIVSCLSIEQMNKFMDIAQTLAMDCLVETHSMDDVEKVLKTNAQIIGINNRNLRTFIVEPKTTLMLKVLLPHGKIVVSESGISSPEIISLYKDRGIHAVLIGEALIRSNNITAKIQELLKVNSEDKNIC
ncbi:indole-3-glycerol phosphate synthase TrpC [Candidatus Desantisbacteria bacterium]|nr:indole-3-glycerol phosphate synthase TrpC [Candidatus Desantisbacteria bacterium]